MATKRKEPESQRISWFLYSFELPLLCMGAKRYSIAGRISAASCSLHSCSINNSFCFFNPSVATLGWKIWSAGNAVTATVAFEVAMSLPESREN